MSNNSKSTATSSSQLSFQDNTTISHEHNIEGQFHTPTYTRKSTRRISQLEPDTTALWETGNKTLDWIKKDEYYCLLVPLTLPVTIYAVFFNWLGMKFFRHN
ncbi:19755_t:CDS:2 [Rhizophagus irregularis]|nr:19755_t:CDS:2 [Rhizophagus irregularis]